MVDYYKDIGGKRYIFVTNIESVHDLVQKYRMFNDKHGGVAIETAFSEKGDEVPDDVAIWLREDLETIAAKEGLFTPSELQGNMDKLNGLIEKGIEGRGRKLH